jgi:peptidoglycan hydrolase-like protein with peptidoglycan-binding domain
MLRNYKQFRNAALSFLLAGGMAGFAGIAQARDYSRDTLRDAQRQLKNDGYYTGSVDGVDGAMTREAIRHYQRDHNLKRNGELNRETREALGLRDSREADRQSDRYADRAETSGTVSPSSATVRAAQRRLESEGFYRGDIDGEMGPRTQAALSEYQRNSNLNVTGTLDQATLSKLGVSK